MTALESLLDALDTLPFASEILLPQGNLVVASAYGQNVAAQRPAHTPDGSIKVEDFTAPLACAG